MTVVILPSLKIAPGMIGCCFKKHTINNGRPTSALQKEKARENALKRNANQKGADNRNAKTWQIEYIDGRIEIVKSIHSWIVLQQVWHL